MKTDYKYFMLCANWNIRFLLHDKEGWMYDCMCVLIIYRKRSWVLLIHSSSRPHTWISQKSSLYLTNRRLILFSCRPSYILRYRIQAMLCPTVDIANFLNVCCTRLSTVHSQAFPVVSARTWNSLPPTCYICTLYVCFPIFIIIIIIIIKWTFI